MSKKDIFKRFLPIVIVTILMSACSKTDKKFLITNNSVGELTKSTKIIQLDSLYRNDSLVKTSLEGEFRYEKGKGKKQLLELTPSIPQEGKPQYIQGVQVLDGRYATDKNISLRSTFGEIKKVYKEFDFEQLISTVVVMPKGSNLFFTFDQNDLLPPLDDTYTIESIPEDAKVKSLMINWVH